MKSILIGLAFLSLSLHAYAEEYPEWLLQALSRNRPQELAYYSHINGVCPITEEEVKEIAESVFVASKVEPFASFGSSDLYMDISVECIRYTADNSIYTLSVKFGQYTVMPATLYNWNIGMFGIGTRNMVSQSLKAKVQEAMAVYMKANPEIWPSA